jgi:hypothetical protein
VVVALVTASPATPLMGYAQADTLQTINFSERTGVIKNPGIGYQTYYRSAVSDRQLPSSVMYIRFNWSQIQRAPGTYDFSVIEHALRQAKAAKQKLAFRIMGFENNNPGPIGLKNAGYPGFSFTFDGHPNVWFPDIDNAIVRQDLTNLIAALGHRYGSNPLIDTIDVGFVGDWGEFHFWNTEPRPPMPTTTSLNALHEMFLTSVKVPLVTGGTLHRKDVSAFIYAVRNRIGWRVDCWGDFDTSGWNHMDNAYPALIVDAGEAWKVAPVILEPCGTMSSWVSANYPWQQTLRWAVDNHASQFSNKGKVIPPVMLPAVQDMLTKLGYRFVLTEARFPASVVRRASFRLTLHWANKGNAPMYFDRLLLIKIGNQIHHTGISMKGFLPGTRIDAVAVGTERSEVGTHDVQIGLAPPGTEAPDITLAIQGAGPWYLLGNLIITEDRQ